MGQEEEEYVQYSTTLFFCVCVLYLSNEWYCKYVRTHAFEDDDKQR